MSLHRRLRRRAATSRIVRSSPTPRARRRSTSPRSTSTARSRDVPIAGEHPLTLYVDKQELLTLMTLGGAPEALAIGYLRNQRLVDSIEDIVSVQVDWEMQRGRDQDAQRPRGPRGEDREAHQDHRLRPGHGVRRPDGGDRQRQAARRRDARRRRRSTTCSTACALHETIYKQAGAVHGCALATNEPGAREILMFVEDVGRHNAVDAIAGRMWLDAPRRRRQDLLHDRPPHLRDGDQGRADAASRSSSRARASRRWATRSRRRSASR